MNSNPQKPEETPNPPDLTGHQLGDFVILRRLGSGGMAHVYLAEQRSLQRKVALKIMRPDLVNDATHVSRFVREAQSAAALSQSNIVQIFEVGQLDGKHYISQEYVEGRNLKQFINRFGAVEVVMAINVLRQVGLALQKAFEEGVIHRDIKPENIMISSGGEVKVTDFGLARMLNEKSKMDLTQVGITLGTPLYMSPEQIEGREVDHRSDLYSLGVTAYHMLAGEPPFKGETALAVAMQHLKETPRSLKSIRPDVPVVLCEMIAKLMAKAPEDRLQNPGELLRELRKIKVEVDEDWLSLAEKLAESRHDAFDGSSSKLAATRQLHSVLKGNIRSFWTQPGFIVPLIFLTLLSVGAGIGMAWMQPVPDPFSRSDSKQSKDGITKKKDVKEQYRAAFWSGDPEHYKAVIDLFPASATDFVTLLYHRRAKQFLGEYYLESGTERGTIEAEKYFRELSLVDDPFYQAVGWAGLACVYDETGIYQLVREELQKLESPSPTLNGEPYFLLLNKLLYDKVMNLMSRYADQNPNPASVSSRGVSSLKP